MKYQDIFKKWHFWLISLSYATYLFFTDITSPEFFISNSIDVVNPDYTIFIVYFILRFLIVLTIYTNIWIFYWRKKKQ